MFQKAKDLCLSDPSFSFSKEEVRDELESFLSQSSKKDSSFVPANDKKSPFSESMRLISLSLSNRPGVREDFEKIIETFSKKVESDTPQIVCHSDFCSHCTFKIFSSIQSGVLSYPTSERKNERARFWLTVSAQLNNPFAQYLMGVYNCHLGYYCASYNKLMHLDTGPLEQIPEFDAYPNVDVDPAARDAAYTLQNESMRKKKYEAITWFERSSTQGHIPSALYICSLLLKSESPFYSIEGAEKWLACAEHIYSLCPEHSSYDMSMTPIISYFRGCMLTLKGKVEESQKHFFTSSLSKCGPAMFELYRLTYNKLEHLKEEEQKRVLLTKTGKSHTNLKSSFATLFDTAREWLKRACDECQYSRAFYEVGYFHSIGDLGFEKNAKLSCKAYAKSAVLGCVGSMCLYSTFVDQGQGLDIRGVKSNHQQDAFNFSLMAAKCGSDMGRIQVALSYKKGKFVPFNLEYCLWWLNLAAKNNSGLAHLELGVCYLEVIDSLSKVAAGSSKLGQTVRNFDITYYNKCHDLAVQHFEIAHTQFQSNDAYFQMGRLYLLCASPNLSPVECLKKVRHYWTIAKNEGFQFKQSEWKMFTTLEQNKDSIKSFYPSPTNASTLVKNQEPVHDNVSKRNKKKKSRAAKAEKKKQTLSLSSNGTKVAEHMKIGDSFSDRALRDSFSSFIQSGGEDVDIGKFVSLSCDKIRICFVCGHIRDPSNLKKLKELEVCKQCKSCPRLKVVELHYPASVSPLINNQPADPSIMKDVSKANSDCYILKPVYDGSPNYEADWVYGYAGGVGRFALVNTKIHEPERCMQYCSGQLEKGGPEHGIFPLFVDIFCQQTNFARFSKHLRLRLFTDYMLKFHEVQKVDLKTCTIVILPDGSLSVRRFKMAKGQTPILSTQEAHTLIFPDLLKDDLFLHLNILLFKIEKPASKEGGKPYTYDLRAKFDSPRLIPLGSTLTLIVSTHPFFCDTDEGLLCYLEKSIKTFSSTLESEIHLDWVNWYLIDYVSCFVKQNKSLFLALNDWTEEMFANFCQNIKLFNFEQVCQVLKKMIPLTEQKEDLLIVSAAVVATTKDENLRQEALRFLEQKTATKPEFEMIPFSKAAEKKSSLLDLLKFCDHFMTTNKSDISKKMKKILNIVPDLWFQIYHTNPLVKIYEKDPKKFEELTSSVTITNSLKKEEQTVKVL